MSIIEVKNITKRFGDKLVVDNISFDINKGDIFGFIGPNGAGKSTVINIITGLLESNTGDVIVGGFSIKDNPVEVKRKIGLVPQEIALMDTVPVYENLEFFGALYDLKGSMLKKRIAEALEITGLTDKKKEKVKKLSGGMKRRLNIAAAIMHYPEILIMDEPTAGIDPQSRNHIFEFVNRSNKELGTTILYTSHYMEEVEYLCNNIFIIDLGKEVARGEKKLVKSMAGVNSRIAIKLMGSAMHISDRVADIEGVKHCNANGDELVLTVSETSFNLEDLIKLLHRANVKIKTISFEEPSLEEVFLSLTGKSLRE